MSSLKRIALITSGGDAPGMNAAIRAVVRSGLYYGLEVLGFQYGYNGLVEDLSIELNTSSVGNIIQRGGTMLKTARSESFRTPEGRAQAAKNLNARNIDALVAIGGNGTFTGAEIFLAEHGIPTIGIPGTIDNDLFGSDYTIGFDTAINTAMEAIDRIRDTANSHDRVFFVEVMGRDAGYIAIDVGIAGGAEAILIPETPTHYEELFEKMQAGWRRNKGSNIIVVAEGDDAGGAEIVAKKFAERFPQMNYRVTVLGHLQRGGSPSARDRVLASRLGKAAVDALIDGKANVMVGVVNDQILHTPFGIAIRSKKEINEGVLALANVLST